MQRHLLPLVLLLGACGPGGDSTDDDPTGGIEPDTDNQGTQIGGIDCIDDEVLVTVLDADGAEIASHMEWNPNGDDQFDSRDCTGSCFLYLYEGLTTYTVRVTVPGFATEERQFTLSEDHLERSVETGECPGDYYLAELEIVPDQPTSGGGGGDCLNDQLTIDVVDDSGAPDRAVLNFPQDGDDIPSPWTKDCDEQCILDVYGGETTYTIDAVTDDGRTGQLVLSVTSDDQVQAHLPGTECPGPYYATSGTVQLSAQ